MRRRSNAAAPRCARGTLRCSISWPAEKLASRPAGVPLKQSRRVRSRSALARAAMSPGLEAAQGLAALPLARHGQSTGLSVSGLASSAPHMSLPTHTHPRLCRHHCSSRRTTRALQRGGRCPGWATCGAATTKLRRRVTSAQRWLAGANIAAVRSARAQRVLRDLTRGDCPSATTAGSEASFAARARREKRSGVGLQGRPPQ